MVRYRVHLSPDSAVSVDAVKVNTGKDWLWFFNADDNLVALFYWRNISGFSVEGSVTGQILTDRGPMEMGKISREEWSEATRVAFEEVQRLRDKRKQRSGAEL